MSELRFEVPPELVTALQELGAPDLAAKECVILELYRRGVISSRKAAELLGMERLEFIHYSGRLGIPYLRSSADEAPRVAGEGSDNVFEDLGFAAEEAANLKVRADLLLDLRQYIQERRWTQAEAAAFFGETQPRISNLLKGEIGRFSVDKLVNMLARAGLEVRVETKKKAA